MQEQFICQGERFDPHNINDNMVYDGIPLVFYKNPQLPKEMS